MYLDACNILYDKYARIFTWKEAKISVLLDQLSEGLKLTHQIVQTQINTFYTSQ